jgi:S1-C subfamily serine protease
LHANTGQCVTIARVKPGTPAARSVPPLVAGMTLVSVDGDLMADADVAAERISSVGRGQMALEVMMPSTTRNWVSRLLRPEARRD